MGIYQFYDKDAIQNSGGEKYDTVTAIIAIADITYKLDDKNALRLELQHLATQDDYGSWAMALLEYSVSPHWFAAVSDQYNYGNDESKKQ